MATFQDNSLGLAVETTPKTYVAPTRHYEIVDHSLNWNPNRVQGKGLRVGSRVARSGRRVTPNADGGGDFTVEALSKGMGLLWQACLGTATSTVVSGATYQQLFTIGDSPSSLSIQTGTPEVGGTVDAYSWLGCTVSQWEFDFPNNDIASLKTTVDIADLSVAQTYVAPSYPTTPNPFHWANVSISTGTLTPPTTTALASASGSTANIRSGTVAFNANVRNDRYNAGGAGRKSRQLPGERAITGTMVIEYDSTTYRDLILNDGTLCVVVTYTGGALSTGVETLQVVLPECHINGDMPAPNGNDLIVQSVKFDALDNLTNQPIYVVHRTADTAL